MSARSASFRQFVLKAHSRRDHFERLRGQTWRTLGQVAEPGPAPMKLSAYRCALEAATGGRS